MNIEKVSSSTSPSASESSPPIAKNRNGYGINLERLTAGDIMSEHVITLSNEMSVAEAATFLVDREISGAPVRNRAGEFLGVVSLTDIVEATSEEPGNLREAAHRAVQGWEYRFTRDDLNNLSIHNVTATVEDIMTPTLYTVPARTPLPEVARTMIVGRIHRLFVTDRTEVVGIVSTVDLLKVIARST